MFINYYSIIVFSRSYFQFTHNSEDKCHDCKYKIADKTEDEGPHERDLVKEVASNPLKDQYSSATNDPTKSKHRTTSSLIHYFRENNQNQHVCTTMESQNCDEGNVKEEVHFLI